MKLLSIACLALTGSVCLAQPATTEFAPKDKGIYKKELEAYDLAVESKDTKLTMQPNAILNWVGDFPKRGSVFVWTLHGRPMVVGQCFSFHSRDSVRKNQLSFKHTFHSLAEDQVFLHHGKDLVWAPRGPGVEFHDADFQTKVHARKALRLSQMRAIGRKFVFRVEGYTKGQLRFLPQPLYRYDSEKLGIIDGAIFSFSFGSDPEALLIVEAVKEGDATSWRYGFARFNLQESHAMLNKKQVWKVGSISEFRGATIGGMKSSKRRQQAKYVSFYSEYSEPLPKESE